MKNVTCGVRLRSVATVSAAALILVLAGRIAPVRAQAAYAFDVPQGDLATVVTRIARTAGTSISFPAGLASGRTAGPIQGSTSVQGALAQALAGTGLQAAPGPSGSLTIREAAPNTPAVTGGDLQAIDVTDDSAASRYGDVGFQAGDVGLGSRLGGASTKDIPITVSVVTQQVIRSQALTTATDAVQNVSGVVLGGADSYLPTFTIRGFQATGVATDGMKAVGFSTGAFGQVPIDDVERVEVLKGPTALLSGATASGGVVNLTTKRPTDRVIRDATVRYGSYGYKTIALDLGGPLAGFDGLTYRFVTSANSASENYAGYRDPHEYLIAPSVQWTDGDTTLLGGIRYFDQKRVPIQYTFIPLSGINPDRPIIRIPRGIPQVNPNLSYSNKTLQIYSEQSHNFGDILGANYTFTNRLRFEHSLDDIHSFAWIGRPASGGRYTARQTALTYEGNRLFEQLDLTGTYDAGFATHTGKFGVDYTASESFLKTFTSPTLLSTNPLLGLPLEPVYTPGSNIVQTPSHFDGTNLGYYYLEKFDTLDNRLHFTGQVRYDEFRFSTNDTTTGGVYSGHVSKTGGITWLAGAAFDVTPYFTAYGSRNTGLIPTQGVNNLTGLPAPTEERDQWEVGGRLFLLDKRLTLTSSYFDQRATNVSICDPTEVGTCTRFIVVPGQSSRGVEFDVQGEVFPGFNVIGSFSSTVVKYESQQYVLPFAGVPQYTASLWGTYAFQDGPMRGLTLGAGAHGNSKSTVYDTNNNNTVYDLPGNIIADAFVGYDIDKWSFSFKINNVFNKYYYQPSYSSRYIGIGQGRNFLFSARYSFE